MFSVILIKNILISMLMPTEKICFYYLLQNAGDGYLVRNFKVLIAL